MNRQTGWPVLLCGIASIWVGTVWAAADAPTMMKALQGVYKHRFPNGTVDGSEKWMSEDVVEIVPMDNRHIYVRAELAFGNGHRCSIHGAAEFNHGQFTLYDPMDNADGPQPCTLRVSMDEKFLRLTDIHPDTGNASCRMYCGARGSLSNYTIARSARRDIRYLPRLKASTQYQEALRRITTSSVVSR